jgi:hypothetical protein
MLALLTRSILGLVPSGASVLDVGAGLEAPYQYGLQRRAKRLVMLDAHQPYLDANQTRGPNVERVIGITPGALKQFHDGEFDVALTIDHIEHLSREDGFELVREMQRVARTVGIFTPLGLTHQSKDNYLMGGDSLQTHRSGWSVEDFKSLGFCRVAEWNPIDPESKTRTVLDICNTIPTAPSCLWVEWRRSPVAAKHSGPKVLITGGFDPAGVCLGHRDVLRDLGFDARVALDVAYTRRQLDADWVKVVLPSAYLSEMLDDLVIEQWRNHEGLLDFAKAADVIQVSPGINHVWNQANPSKTMLDLHLPPAGKLGEDFGIKDWLDVNRNASRVAFFHGSLRTWEHREEYNKHYRNLGYTLAASTLDYACEMDAVYLPPIVCNSMPPLALPRRKGDPLIVIHTPTDREASQTKALVAVCRDLDIEIRIFEHKDHQTILREKCLGNVGFDHMRGSFSVNHLENCQAGLAALVGLKPQYRERMLAEGFSEMPLVDPRRPVLDQDSLRHSLQILKDSADMTQAMQYACTRWVYGNFDIEKTSRRLHLFYGSLA